MVGNIPGVVFKGYKDWGVDVFDDRIEPLTGFGKEDFNTRRIRWSDLILKEDVEASKNAIRRALQGEKSYGREYRIRSRQGQIVWILDRGKVICHEE